MSYINKINHNNYRKHLEYDLYQLLDPNKSIKYAFPFFDLTADEDQIESNQGKYNLHCNFEEYLKEDVPLEWSNQDDLFIINRFKDDRNQIDQIREELRSKKNDP